MTSPWSGPIASHFSVMGERWGLTGGQRSHFHENHQTASSDEKHRPAASLKRNSQCALLLGAFLPALGTG